MDVGPLAFKQGYCNKMTIINEQANLMVFLGSPGKYGWVVQIGHIILNSFNGYLPRVTINGFLTKDRFIFCCSWLQIFTIGFKEKGKWEVIKYSKNSHELIVNKFLKVVIVHLQAE